MSRSACRVGSRKKMHNAAWPRFRRQKPRRPARSRPRDASLPEDAEARRVAGGVDVVSPLHQLCVCLAATRVAWRALSQRHCLFPRLKSTTWPCRRSESVRIACSTTTQRGDAASALHQLDGPNPRLAQYERRARQCRPRPSSGLLRMAMSRYVLVPEKADHCRHALAVERQVGQCDRSRAKAASLAHGVSRVCAPPSTRSSSPSTPRSTSPSSMRSRWWPRPVV
jgi:hypothetical protein